MGRKLRYLYYKRRLGSCGKSVTIDINVVIHSPRQVHIGEYVWIDQGVIILAGKLVGERKIHIKNNKLFPGQPGELHVGSEVHIGPQVILQAHGGIQIGNRLTVAAGSKLYSVSHHYRNIENPQDETTYYFGSMVPKSNQYLVQGAIVVGDDSAVGLNSILLPGSYVPRGTWLAAGTIIRDEELQENSIYYNEQVLHHKNKE